jgi:lipopolysaccharide export system ATP-binding protein
MINTLEADSVILEFGSKRVLNDVYLLCESGKLSGLLGLNGAGKSCLMNIIYGNLQGSDNSVRINGKALLNNFRSPKLMRYLPQFNFIPGSLTINRVLKDFGIDYNRFFEDFPDIRKYHRSTLSKLSTGEKRIVEIYSVLMSDSQFCMLDEPFSQVMPVHVEKIKELITNEKANKGILITDHLYTHIMDICDSVYLILDGSTKPIISVDELHTYGYVNNI